MGATYRAGVTRDLNVECEGIVHFIARLLVDCRSIEIRLPGVSGESDEHSLLEGDVGHLNEMVKKYV